MTTNLDLASVAADYLRTRRSLGYRLAQQGQLLVDFVGYLRASGADHLTIEHALAWAKRPLDANPVWWSAKLGVVRGFARYLSALDPATEVPPAGLLPDRNHRALPYIYTDAEVVGLIDAAGRLRPPLRAATYQTLIGLLAVTGMRVGEAIGLDRRDLDPKQHLVTIRFGKFGKSRQLPLHASTVGALRGYARLRDAQGPGSRAPSFFVSTAGTRLIGDNAGAVFSRLVRNAGLDWSGRRRPPRLHDLRHYPDSPNIPTRRVERGRGAWRTRDNHSPSRKARSASSGR